MKTSKTTLVALTICLGSCSGIEFDPDIYLPNVSKQHLINEDGRTVPFQSKAMTQYGCMHEDKWKELNEILENNKIMGTAVPRILDRINSNKSPGGD